MRKFILLILVSIICGCAHIDYIASFAFTGKVVDKSSRKPLEGVEIYFVDTGLDYVRSKTKEQQLMGNTKVDGTFSFQINYWWGQEHLLSHNKSKGSYAVKFSKKGYVDKIIFINLSDATQDNVLIKNDLYTINLEPINIKS